MFKEASMFAAHLRQVEKDLTAWERDIEGAPRLVAAACARLILPRSLCMMTFWCSSRLMQPTQRGPAWSVRQRARTRCSQPPSAAACNNNALIRPAPHPHPPPPSGGFTNFRSIMLSPLPRVYEEGHNGQAVPSEPEPSMIGGDVQVERLTSAAQETKKRLEIEVLQPIKQWMVAYRTIMVRAVCVFGGGELMAAQVASCMIGPGRMRGAAPPAVS